MAECWCGNGRQMGHEGPHRADDKVRKEVAEGLRQLLAGAARDEDGFLFVHPTTIASWRDLLDPPPEPEKPMRWWVVDAVLAGYPSRRPYELFYQTVKPAGDYIEVCIHPADAPHCDIPRHADIDRQTENTGSQEPRCDVEGHDDLRRQANDFGVEVERLKRQLQERDALMESNKDATFAARVVTERNIARGRVSELEDQLKEQAAATQFYASSKWQSAAVKLANEVAELKRVVTERDALLREVAVQFHVTQACHPCSEHVQPFDDCGTNRCSRVRAALAPATPKKV